RVSFRSPSCRDRMELHEKAYRTDQRHLMQSLRLDDDGRRRGIDHHLGDRIERAIDKLALENMEKAPHTGLGIVTVEQWGGHGIFVEDGCALIGDGVWRKRCTHIRRPPCLASRLARAMLGNSTSFSSRM